MINRASLDPSLLAQPEARSHGAVVREIARNQSRLGRLARAVGVAIAAPTPDSASTGRLARMTDAQATADTVATARQFEVTSERLMSMNALAAAARAADLSAQTRANASRQFETLRWQALEALHDAASRARSAGLLQIHFDPAQIGQALSQISIATPDQAAAAQAALDAALAAVDNARNDIAETASTGDDAEYLDPTELAKRIAEQAAKSAGAQANIAPANAKLLLS